MDVSINSAGGVHAAALVGRHMAALPALRPLALTLKALLRAAAPAPLHDVATGGLGSYSLVNMLAAHLMQDAQVHLFVWVLLGVPTRVLAMGLQWAVHAHPCACGAQKVLRSWVMNPKP